MPGVRDVVPANVLTAGVEDHILGAIGLDKFSVLFPEQEHAGSAQEIGPVPPAIPFSYIGHDPPRRIPVQPQQIETIEPERTLPPELIQWRDVQTRAVADHESSD